MLRYIYIYFRTRSMGFMSLFGGVYWVGSGYSILMYRYSTYNVLRTVYDVLVVHCTTYSIRKLKITINIPALCHCITRERESEREAGIYRRRESVREGGGEGERGGRRGDTVRYVIRLRNKCGTDPCTSDVMVGNKTRPTDEHRIPHPHAIHCSPNPSPPVEG